MKTFFAALCIVVFISVGILGSMIWIAPNMIEEIFSTPPLLTAETRWI